MGRTAWISGFAASVGLLAACGGAGDRSLTEARRIEARPAPVSVTGCLTASGDRFVLTELERSAADRQTDVGAPGHPATETYQLTGANERLRQYIGREVRILGEARPPAVAVVREISPSAPAAPASPVGTSGAGPEPKVSTEQQTRLEVTKADGDVGDANR